MKPLYSRRNVPFELYEANILNADEKELLRISSELGLSLNLQEMKKIKKYFEEKCRNPTDVELQTLGQTWSEHCFHKTFKGIVRTSEGEVIDSLFKMYIAKAAEELKKTWCVSVFEDNAGIIQFEDDMAVAVKVETHNHPSAIEPFGGAATGTGGVIRDVLGFQAEDGIRDHA